jgi:hypothetical protein
MRRATESVRSGNIPKGNGHLFALFLLTEFEAKEALPAILDAISLPGEGPFDLFGDALTEDLGSVLAALADDLDTIEQLITNRDLNEYVRWKAVQTYLYLVRDGRLSRDEAVERLRGHLRDAIADRDADLVSGLVAELVSYSPREAMDEIRDAYRRDLVNRVIVGPSTVERSIAEGDARFRRELEHCRATGVHDTVEELSRWAAFRQDDELSDYRFEVPAEFWTTNDRDIFSAAVREENAGEPLTIRNTGPKVGRNDPCPCGSGKKFKKCCGTR